MGHRPFRREAKPRSTRPLRAMNASFPPWPIILDAQRAWIKLLKIPSDHFHMLEWCAFLVPRPDVIERRGERLVGKRREEFVEFWNPFLFSTNSLLSCVDFL